MLWFTTQVCVSILRIESQMHSNWFWFIFSFLLYTYMYMTETIIEACYIWFKYILNTCRCHCTQRQLIGWYIKSIASRRYVLTGSSSPIAHHLAQTEKYQKKKKNVGVWLLVPSSFMCVYRPSSNYTNLFNSDTIFTSSCCVSLLFFKYI